MQAMLYVQDWIQLLRVRTLLTIPKIIKPKNIPRFEDLSEFPSDALVPPLDRAEVDEAALTPDQRSWRENGVLILPGLMPDDLVDPYCRVRERLRRRKGWRSPVPYMHVGEIRELCLHPPLMAKLAELFGTDMFMHLNLTGWESTERDWHQDDYLNPSFVNGWYCAVWFALDDVHPDAGPFEYVPGSHRWPVLRDHKVRAHLTPTELSMTDIRSGASFWPLLAERITTPSTADMIRRSGLPQKTFLGKKGDVLIWHARLLHRGSKPRRRSLLRKAIITHYSAVGHRPDMPPLLEHAGGGKYARFELPLM